MVATAWRQLSVNSSWWRTLSRALPYWRPDAKYLSPLPSSMPCEPRNSVTVSPPQSFSAKWFLDDQRVSSSQMVDVVRQRWHDGGLPQDSTGPGARRTVWIALVIICLNLGMYGHQDIHYKLQACTRSNVSYRTKDSRSFTTTLTEKYRKKIVHVKQLGQRIHLGCTPRCFLCPYTCLLTADPRPAACWEMLHNYRTLAYFGYLWVYQRPLCVINIVLISASIHSNVKQLT